MAPESQTWGAACGNLNTVVQPITVNADRKMTLIGATATPLAR
jgi:hypothetical protein